MAVIEMHVYSIAPEGRHLWVEINSDTGQALGPRSPVTVNSQGGSWRAEAAVDFLEQHGWADHYTVWTLPTLGIPVHRSQPLTPKVQLDGTARVIVDVWLVTI